MFTETVGYPPVGEQALGVLHEAKMSATIYLAESNQGSKRIGHVVFWRSSFSFCSRSVLLTLLGRMVWQYLIIVANCEEKTPQGDKQNPGGNLEINWLPRA